MGACCSSNSASAEPSRIRLSVFMQALEEPKQTFDDQQDSQTALVKSQDSLKNNIRGSKTVEA
jgi:hypothetical protein